MPKEEFPWRQWPGLFAIHVCVLGQWALKCHTTLSQREVCAMWCEPAWGGQAGLYHPQQMERALLRRQGLQFSAGKSKEPIPVSVF
jgi:hypothetical protein